MCEIAAEAASHFNVLINHRIARLFNNHVSTTRVHAQPTRRPLACSCGRSMAHFGVHPVHGL